MISRVIIISGKGSIASLNESGYLGLALSPLVVDLGDGAA